jgi:hypothetical protein
VRVSSGATVRSATGSLETCSSGERSKTQSGSLRSGPMNPMNPMIPRKTYAAPTILGAIRTAQSPGLRIPTVQARRRATPRRVGVAPRRRRR